MCGICVANPAEAVVMRWILLEMDTMHSDDPNALMSSMRDFADFFRCIISTLHVGWVGSNLVIDLFILFGRIRTKQHNRC